MTQPLPQSLIVVLCDEESGRIVVDFEAYTRFHADFDRQLALLEAQFAHLAPRRWRQERRLSSTPKPRKPR